MKNKTTVHVLQNGFPFCGLGHPRDWPPGNLWVGINELKDATCPRCREAVKQISGATNPKRGQLPKPWPDAGGFDTPPRADEVLEWAQRTFGPVACSGRERALRFVEEAVEAGHAAGIDIQTLLRIVVRVYEKQSDPGDLAKEIGQARMTLAAFAWVWQVDDTLEYAREWHRVDCVSPEEHRARHKRKVEQGFAEQ